MSGKWVTVQSKTNKRPKRKAADSSDEESDSDYGNSGFVRNAFESHKPAATTSAQPQKSIGAQIKAEERAEAAAALRKEQQRAAKDAEKLAKRHEAQRRAEEEAASRLSVVDAMKRRCKNDPKSFLHEVAGGLVGVAGAEASSYLRALAVISVMEKFFATSVDKAELERAAQEEGTKSEALMPMAAIDSVTDTVIDHLNPYVRFVGDGDAETMTNLITDCFGPKGAKEDVSMGQLYGLQLILAANLEPALDSIGLVGEAFTSKGVKFHTLTSFRNFLRVVDTIFFQLTTTPMSRGSSLEHATKRGMLHLFRTLSRIDFDHIPPAFQWAHRVRRTVADLRVILQELGLEEKAVALKHQSIVAEPSDFELFGHLHRASSTVEPAELFLDELVLWHHPDSVRSSFVGFLAAVDAELRREKASHRAEALLSSVLHRGIALRPAEVFGVWTDHFIKYPVASAALTVRMVQQKTMFDVDFVKVVRGRCEKALTVKRSDTQDVLCLKESIAALDGKHTVVRDIVAVAKQSRKLAQESARQGGNNNKATGNASTASKKAAKESRSDAKEGEDKGRSACVSFLMIAVTMGCAAAFVYSQNHKA